MNDLFSLYGDNEPHWLLGNDQSGIPDATEIEEIEPNTFIHIILLNNPERTSNG